MKVDPHRVACRDCDWSEVHPSRDHAEHAKRVHEFTYDHTVVIEPAEE